AAHRLIALGGVFLERCLPRKLCQRRDAGQRRVDHLARGLDQARATDSGAQSPTAPAIRLAERVRGPCLIPDAGLRELWMMGLAPGQVAIRFVAEDCNGPTAYQVGHAAKIIVRGNAAGRIVRRIEEYRPRPGFALGEPVHVVEIWTELIRLAERTVDSPGAAPLDVRAVCRKVWSEDQDGIAWIEHRFAEKLLKDLRAEPDDDVFWTDLDAELAPIIPRDGFSKLRQTQ